MVAGRTWRWGGIVIVIILVLILLVILFMYSGVYSVAANYPDRAPVVWFFGTITDNSVKHHAKDIKVPPLNDPAMIRDGAISYQTRCVMCHGAPGVSVSEVGRGLNPPPPPNSTM